MRFRVWHLLLVLGILFALTSVFFVFMAASIRVDEKRGEDIDMTSDVPIFCCLPFFLPEAIVFLALSVFFWIKAKTYRELASRLESYRIIKVHDLAMKMGNKEDKARKMVETCIKRKYVKGRLDEKKDTFYTDEYLKNTKNLINGWKCKTCGAQNDEILLPGEIGKCAYCGDVLDNKTRIDVNPSQASLDSKRP